MWTGWLVIVRLPTRILTLSPVRATKGSMPGKALLFQVHRLKSSMVFTLGVALPGSMS